MCELWYARKHPAAIPRKTYLYGINWESKKHATPQDHCMDYIFESSLGIRIYGAAWDWCSVMSCSCCWWWSIWWVLSTCGCLEYCWIDWSWRNGWMGALLTRSGYRALRAASSVAQSPRASSCLKWHSLPSTLSIPPSTLHLKPCRLFVGLTPWCDVFWNGCDRCAVVCT